MHYAMASTETITPPLSPRVEMNHDGNPFNLRPIVAAVMDMENWLLDRLPPGQKLVILYGEHHNQMRHSFLQHALYAAHIEQAQKNPQRSFGIGFEINHKFANTAKDPDGQITLKEYQAEQLLQFNNAKTHKTPMQQKILGYTQGQISSFQMLSSNRVSLNYNDIAAKYDKDGYVIDQEDLPTYNLIKKVRPHLLNQEIARAGLPKSQRFTEFQDGIALSNYFMVDRSIEHMERAQKQIYMLVCGMTHTFGVQSEVAGMRSYEFKDSLAGIFEQKSIPTLTLLADTIFQGVTIPENPGPLVIAKRFYRFERAAEKLSYDYPTVRRLVNAASGLDL